jgi:ATP-binding cassette, subfamily B, multidrug efflux pump
MYGEYGYMEEGKLGKAYNFRLLKRLGTYAFPYGATMAKALLMTILIAAIDLSFPYLLKIALDRYILSAWYPVHSESVSEPETRRITTTYGHLLVSDRTKKTLFISSRHIKGLDPTDLHAYRQKGVIGTTAFYRAEADALGPAGLTGRAASIYELTDGTVMVPFEVMGSLSKEETLALRAGDVRMVAILGLLILALLFVSYGFGYAEYYLLEYTGQHIMQDIRLELFRRMQAQAVRFFDRHPVGRLVTRVTNDVENLNEMFKSVVITVFKDIFVLVGILAVLLYMNWKLALVCFTLVPVIFGLALLFSTLAREAFRELRATVARINAFLQERLSGMRVIQLFVMEAHQGRAFEKINRDNYLAGMKQIRVFAVFMPLMELASACAIGLLIWHGGGKVISEQLTLGALVAFITYIQMFFRPIRDISEKYNIMQAAMASTERIFEFLDHHEEIPEPVRPIQPVERKGRLTFEDVTFGYQTGKPVVKDVSFDVAPGRTVAVVGATGAGKSTLVNLVERFYDPDAGAVLLDGVDLRQLASETLRSRMGLVMQDVFIFSGKLKENISLGDSRINEDAIRDAARKANALPFIHRLPHGFDQELGEGGVNLSAGERQLLSFARALAGDPLLLILDEATSSVDPETERSIQEAISRITRKQTTLVVAHRLSTVREADRILVMHHGRIVEQGRHDELMALRGIYYRLHLLQER